MPAAKKPADQPYAKELGPDPDPFAVIIRTAMDAKGWTVTEASTRMGISRSTVSCWRAKDRLTNFPETDNLIAIARTLDIPRADLLAAAAESTGYLQPTGTRSGLAGMLPPDVDELSPENEKLAVAFIEQLIIASRNA